MADAPPPGLRDQIAAALFGDPLVLALHGQAERIADAVMPVVTAAQAAAFRQGCYARDAQEGDPEDLPPNPYEPSVGAVEWPPLASQYPPIPTGVPAPAPGPGDTTHAGDEAPGRGPLRCAAEYLPGAGCSKGEGHDGDHRDGSRTWAEPGPTTHDLKTWPPFFDHVTAGHKPFEVRRNDRDYRAGDHLRLREWDPDALIYTGREATYRVTYALDSSRHDGVAPGHVVMGITPAAPPDPLGPEDAPDTAAIRAQYRDGAAQFPGGDSWQMVRFCDALDTARATITARDSEISRLRIDFDQAIDARNTLTAERDETARLGQAPALTIRKADRWGAWRGECTCKQWGFYSDDPANIASDWTHHVTDNPAHHPAPAAGGTTGDPT